MSREDDRIFIKHFSSIIAALVVFTVVIALLAMRIHSNLTPSDNPSKEARVAERLKPAADVYVGDAGQEAINVAQAEATDAAPPASDGSLNGEMIYTNACAACHGVGVAGAPKLSPGDWTERLAKGTDALYASAINGIGIMPAKGGRADLSDDQVKASVDYMLGQVQ